jgi:hypothetical protein
MAALDLSLPPGARSSQLWTLAMRQGVAIFVPVVASPLRPRQLPGASPLWVFDVLKGGRANDVDLLGSDRSDRPVLLSRRPAEGLCSRKRIPPMVQDLRARERNDANPPHRFRYFLCIHTVLLCLALSCRYGARWNPPATIKVSRPSTMSV